MVTSERPPANGFVRFIRKIYNPIGFSKGYNALLWFIFDGALFGFVLSRFEYLNFSGIYCNPNSTGGTAPSECYWETKFPRNHYGLIIHLATILPAGLLAVFQFVPAIRHRVLLYHRIAGYVIILLVLVSNGSVLAIANHSFGGHVEARVAVGLGVILTTSALFLAIYNVKRLQIEQHRAWMLRAWAYLGFIITQRIIQIAMAGVVAAWGGEATQYDIMSCSELLFMSHGNRTNLYANYPVCNPSAAQYSVDDMAIVRADLNLGTGATISAALAANFGTSALLALFIHVIGVEIYLKLTPREFERLRRLSYEKQLEKGFKNPGSAGWTIDKFGDAEPWVPPQLRNKSSALSSPVSHESLEVKRDARPSNPLTANI